MISTVTIRAELESYIKKEGITLHQFAETSGINVGTLSGIINGNRPISIGQLDLITEIMGLPEGSYYEMYVDESFASSAPHWRRLRPFLLRCAELRRHDCIQKVLVLLIEDIKQVAGIFETAEIMFEQGLKEAAILLYECVVESERSSHCERLAISYFRLFQIYQKDNHKNFTAAAQFIPYRHRLPEHLVLDGLVMLAELYYVNKDWDEVEKYTDELCNLTEILYRKRCWETPDFRPSRSLVYYYGIGYLYKGACYEFRRMFSESRKWIAKYADLSWFESLDQNMLVEVERYKMFARANLLSIDVKEGRVSRIPEYIEFLKENPSEVLEGLITLLESANRHKFFVDEHLSLFSDEIKYYLSISKQIPDDHNNQDFVYKEQVHTFRCSLFFQKYAIYCFRKKMLAEGIKNTLLSLKFSIRINSKSMMANSMILYEFYRDYSTTEQQTTYIKLCEEAWDNEEEFSMDDYANSIC
ncbi:helix-turn-helix domain-containing protein [Paenibacillus aceti]|uniref:HTH cro/C1-type domain-containing protein n=1 Tax=Paenibacillus aceti TaxID=1820010 RepID=A0ABQ1VVI4_9BACL|nr:helix-turn-helix transcriptional regulator [Paenibacillus aceti]GGF97901.1 hypothetical protein GCM10010913_19580 [Paenibacillus aceti]